MTTFKDIEQNEKKFLHQFGDFGNKRVLEIGCGEGRLTWTYAPDSHLTVGFDTDLYAVRIAQAKRPTNLAKTVSFTHAEAERLPYVDESFDIAVLAWSF